MAEARQPVAQVLTRFTGGLQAPRRSGTVAGVMALETTGRATACDHVREAWTPGGRDECAGHAGRAAAAGGAAPGGRGRARHPGAALGEPALRRLRGRCGDRRL